MSAIVSKSKVDSYFRIHSETMRTRMNWQVEFADLHNYGKEGKPATSRGFEILCSIALSVESINNTLADYVKDVEEFLEAVYGQTIPESEQMAADVSIEEMKAYAITCLATFANKAARLYREFYKEL